MTQKPNIKKARSRTCLVSFRESSNAETPLLQDLNRLETRLDKGLLDPLAVHGLHKGS